MVKFFGHDCTVRFVTYNNPVNLGIELLTEDGDRMAMATVNSTVFPREMVGYALIKNWSENEGILEALVDAGIVRDTGKKISMGLVYANIVEVLVAIPDHVLSRIQSK